MEQTPNQPTEESIFSEEEFSMEGYDKHIRNARIVLFVIAGFNLLALITIFPLDDDPQRIFMAIFAVVLAGIYVALGLWTKKKPYTALLTALILFVSTQVLSAVAEPASIMQGWIFKIIIIVLLVLGLRNAKDCQRMMETFGKKR